MRLLKKNVELRMRMRVLRKKLRVESENEISDGKIECGFHMSLFLALRSFLSADIIILKP